MIFKLTKNQAQEVLHKMGVLADDPDLQETYELSQEQADALRDSVPHLGGAWEVPDGPLLVAACGEMQDHAIVLRDISASARDSMMMGEALTIAKQATFFERIFDRAL